MGQDPVVLLRDERPEQGCPHLAVVQWPEGLIHIVEQREDDQLLVGPVAHGPGGRLHSVLQTVDGMGGVTLEAAEHGEQEVGELGQVALVHLAHDLEVRVGPVVEAVKVHLAQVGVGHERNGTKQADARTGGAARQGGMARRTGRCICCIDGAIVPVPATAVRVVRRRIPCSSTVGTS
jgi:hypothetical protein